MESLTADCLPAVHLRHPKNKHQASNLGVLYKMRKSRRTNVDGDQACLFLSRTANFVSSSCDLILELLRLQGNFFERSSLMISKDLRKGQKSQFLRKMKIMKITSAINSVYFRTEVWEQSRGGRGDGKRREGEGRARGGWHS